MPTPATKPPQLHNTALAGIAAAILVATAFFAFPAQAQTTPAPPTTDLAAPPTSPSAPPPPSTQLTAEQVQAKVQEISVAEDLDEALKTKALELYHAALARLEAAKTNTANAINFQQSIDLTPPELARVQEALTHADAQPHPTEPHDIPTNATAKDLEQTLANKQADLTNLKAKLTDLEQQIKTQQDRPELARVQLATANQMLVEINKELAAAAQKDEHPRITEARRILLNTRNLARSSEVNMIEQELLSHPARIGLLRAQRDLTARLIAIAAERIKKLQTDVNDLRRIEAENARADAERARREAVGKQPAVRVLAERNAELAKEQAQLETNIESAVNTHRDITEQLEALEKQFNSARDKLDIAGLSNALGPVLREQRKSLPDMRRYRKILASRTNLMAEHGLRYLKVEEQRRALADLQGYLERFLDDLDVKTGVDYDPADLEARARRLLEDQRALLDKLAESYGGYLNQLGSLNFEEKQLVDLANQYASFLDEKLLWIPSTQPISLQTLDDLWLSLTWATSTTRWGALARVVWQDSISAPLVTGLAAMVCILMITTRKRIRTQLEVYNGRVGTVYADNFWLTVGAVGGVIALAAPLPFIAGYIALRLLRLIDTAEFTKAIGAGLATAAAAAFILESMRHLCRDKGVAQTHFRWRPQLTTLLRRSALWMLPMATTTGFIVAATEWHIDETYRRSLGRLAFIFGMAAVAAFIRHVFRRTRDVDASLVALKRNGWLSHLFWLWYPAIIGAPLALAALAAVGYYYTAYELAQRFLATIGVFAALALTNALVMRWLLVARQRLELSRAREKRKAAAASRATAPDKKSSPQPKPDKLEFPEVAIEAIDEHTRRLLRAFLGIALFVGLWLIWTPVLPALRIFDDVELWNQTVSLDGEDVVRAITLANLTTAVLLVIVTAIAARNLPGVLELAVLQRLPIDPGSRYAITTTCRYIITAAGIVFAFNAIGIGWSKVQWLIAALGVGLGFGLQEIFANFISGLIILVERPFRVGDTVTVGAISGTVSRLQIRATTITDWDRKELIVPNKEFITGQIINWTLSDAIMRVVVRVGVAYGSDTNLTQTTLLEVAKAEPLVLRDPPPTVIFNDFGDSSLNFDLRVFVGNINNFIQARHNLHMRIDEAFRNANIEIAFPQRDLHMNTTHPLEIRVIENHPATTKT